MCIRDTVDPIIEFTCMNIKKYTSSKKDIGPTSKVHWSEHLFFEPKKMVRNFVTFSTSTYTLQESLIL